MAEGGKPCQPDNPLARLLKRLSPGRGKTQSQQCTDDCHGDSSKQEAVDEKQDEGTATGTFECDDEDYNGYVMINATACSVDADTPVNIDVKSKTLKLSRKGITGVQQFDAALRSHPNPTVVGELILTGKHELKAVPLSIGYLDNLKVLNLRDNHIDDLPWSVVFLKCLRVLDLSYNMLTVLPKTIGCLSSLVELNLEANHLKHLPTDLLKLEALQVLNVERNKLISPTLAVCRKGVPAVFSALRERRKRTNEWEFCTAWVRDDSCGDGQQNTHTQSLFDLCVKVVIMHKVDFLPIHFVPPVMKTHLDQQVKEFSQRLQVSKCGTCKRFYSTREEFDNHNCNQ